MESFINLMRQLLPIVFGAVVLWFILAGIFALSLFVILPLIVIFAAIGVFFYWRYSKMLTSASEGEIGQALQAIDPDQTGLVRFNRQMQTGTMTYNTNVNVACTARTPIESGATVCVESVRGKTIFVKRMVQ